MAVKPAKAIADLLARKQILKVDRDNNILFKVSGSLGSGAVSSSLPITASSYFSAFDSIISGTLTTKNLAITDEKSYVNINQLSNVSASDATEGKFLTYDGTNWIPSEIQINAGIGAQTYSSLRYHSDGLFNGNQVIILDLPLSSAYGPSFPVESINYFTYNLLIQEESGSSWKNDLAIVEFVVTGTGTPYVSAIIEAQVVPYAYTFNATNENTADLRTSVAFNGFGVSEESYNRLRFHDLGYFTSDQAEIPLPLESTFGVAFPTGSLKYITYNVLIKETPESNWKNDLASVEFKISGSQIWAIISAPANPYAYTFNATNNNPLDVPSDVSIANYTNVFVSNNLEVLGNIAVKGENELSNIGSNLLVDDLYNVADVFSAVDTRFAQMVTNFNNLREVQIGNFDVYGNKIVTLNNFISDDIDYLSLDVMVKYSGSTQYVNDLMSIRMSGTLDNKINVEINAPSVTSEDFYRIIAVKESGSI